MRRKGELVGEGLTSIALWILFFIVAGTAVFFLLRRLTG